MGAAELGAAVNGPALLFSLLLLAVNGFFVAAEFALIASRRSRLEQLAAAGDGRARSAVTALRELSLMLAAAQLGITMASFGLGALAEPAIAQGIESLLHSTALPEGAQHAIGFGVGLSLVVFLHMVVGEMAPKSWAIAHPEDSALLLVRPFRAFAVVCSPAIKLMNALANATVRAVGVTPQEELAQAHSPTDLLLLLQESAEHGTLHVEHKQLLSRAIDLSGLDAEDAMIPRGEIVWVDAAATVDQIELVAARTGRSRLLVVDGDLDRVSGVLHVKDLLDLDPHDLELRDRTHAADLARPALVVPESRHLEDLLVDMRAQRRHVALIIDEYGGTRGLVTMEDVLEELIGDFEDESDRDRRALRRVEDGTVLVPGSLRLDELEDRTGVALPPGPYETAAGFVLQQLGRLAVPGDAVRTPGARLAVTRTDGHRILELAVRREVPEPG